MLRKVNRGSSASEERAKIINDREHPVLAAGCQLVMNKVHRPGLVGPGHRPAVIVQLGLGLAPWRFVAQLQVQFAIDAAGIVLTVSPSFAAHLHMDTAIAVAPANMADLLDQSFEGGLLERRDL